MRIAQVAPLVESVPPKLYGGTERVVSWLTEELVALGHEVTLFASGDSVTSAFLVPGCRRALRLDSADDLLVSYAALLEMVSRMASDFDIIHCHTEWLHLPLLRRTGIPFVTTLHGRLDLPGLGSAIDSFRTTPFVSVSDSQRTPRSDLNWVGTVHHGIPPDLLQPCFAPHDYLAFLGRVAPEKGPETAIRWAKAGGRSLRIAAKVPRGEKRYFDTRIAPLLGNDVTFLGEVGEQEKQSFLGNAAALLFPIDWPEPFGLVMIEAMACGTPVIATRHGAVSEIIADGINGLLVDSEQEALAAISRVAALDRRRVRDEFERRFTARRMTNDYVAIYQELAAAHARAWSGLISDATCAPAVIPRDTPPPPRAAVDPK